MPSMQGFGSRRLMANPCTGYNCANATAAMRPGTPPHAFSVMPRECGASSTPIYHCCGGIPDHPLEPVIGLAEGETRWRVMTAVSAVRGSLPLRQGERGRRSLRLVGCGLLAFGTEFLALFAVKPLGVGLLGAFERCLGPRLLGLLFRGCHFCSWRRRSRRGGLRERRAHQEQGCECGCGCAGRYGHHGGTSLSERRNVALRC